MSCGTFTLRVFSIPCVDRGVGLCIGLRTPGGRTWLYDTGTGYPDGAGGWWKDANTGRDRVAPWLRSLGVSELDGVIVSHAHYDHFGGLLWLAERVPIRLLVDTGYEFEGWRDAHYDRELADFSRLRESFRQRGAWRGVVGGEVLDVDEALLVRAIAPPRGFFHDPDPASRPGNNPAAHYMLNTNSLMLRIRHGDVDFLLPGDIEHQDQARLLVPSVPAEDLRCRVLVAPGHGLHTAPEFVAATQPEITLVSLFEQWLGSCTALEGFSRAGSKVYVTGRDGDIEVHSDGAELQVRCERR